MSPGAAIWSMVVIILLIFCAAWVSAVLGRNLRRRAERRDRQWHRGHP